MTDPQTTNWFLPADAINELQQSSMEKMMRLCPGSHHIDVIVRYEGQDKRFEADWIKHLEKQPCEKATGNATTAETSNCVSGKLGVGGVAQGR